MALKGAGADVEFGDLIASKLPGDGDSEADAVDYSMAQEATPGREDKEYGFLEDSSKSATQTPGPFDQPQWTFACRRCFRVFKGRYLWLRVRLLLHYAVFALGLYYLLTILSSLLGALCPETSDYIASRFREYSPRGSEVFPVACHSHNDYWRPKPLLSALEYGCTAVEADVWLSDSDELLVGHTRDSVSSNRTLSNLYLDPLFDILDHANPAQDTISTAHSSHPLNGVFETAPTQSLILLLDFKSIGTWLWPKINDALTPLRSRNYLTRVDPDTNNLIQGPITIVASGKAPFNKILDNPLHDIFYDAPLDLMSTYTPPPTSTLDPEPAAPRFTVTSPYRTLNLSDPTLYTSANSYYASASFIRSIGYPAHSKLSYAQLATMRAQIQGAHALGLKVRYWGIPAWPIGVRNYLWRVMIREGVDYLSADDIKAVATENWGPRKGGWGRKWWD